MADLNPQAHAAAPVGAGHQEDEVGIGRIFAFAGVLVSVIAAVMVVLVALMGVFKGREETLASNRPALFNDESGQFPTPRLQRNYTYDMNKLREEEAATLSSYGWVDPKAGIGRIPIDRAIAILAERGLPTPGHDAVRKAETPAPVAAEPKKK